MKDKLHFMIPERRRFDSMKQEGERRKVKELLERGMSYSDIARLLGIHRHTVKALSEREKNHVQQRKKKGSKLDPFKEYLLKRMLEDQVLSVEGDPTKVVAVLQC